MNISWIPLGIHQARGFPSYTVIVSSEGTLFKSTTTNDSSTVIGELNNNRVYTVNVQPLTGGGPGVQSETGTWLYTMNLNNFYTYFYLPVTFGSPTVTPAANNTWAIAFIVIVIILILICLIIVIVVLLW